MSENSASEPNPDPTRFSRPGERLEPPRSPLQAFAKQLSNPVFSTVRGRFAGYNLRKAKDGKFYLDDPYEGPRAAEPKPDRFKEASDYAVRALTETMKKSRYEAVAREMGVAPSVVAALDFMQPPVISGLDLSHYTGCIRQPIIIEAADSIGLAEVSLQISLANGRTLESAAHTTQKGAVRWFNSLLNRAQARSCHTSSVHSSSSRRAGGRGPSSGV